MSKCYRNIFQLSILFKVIKSSIKFEHHFLLANYLVLELNHCNLSMTAPWKLLISTLCVPCIVTLRHNDKLNYSCVFCACSLGAL